MNFCPDCGAKLVLPPGHFCSECGIALGTRTVAAVGAASIDRDSLIAVVGKGWDLLESGNSAEAELAFRSAGELGWPGGWLSLSHVFETQSRVAEASECAERAFNEADALLGEDDRLVVKAAAALGAARCLMRLASEVARKEIADLVSGSEIGAGSEIMSRVPKYFDFLLTADGIDAETAVLGAELGGKFFMMFGQDGGAGANYGRMLDCLGFVAQWGTAQQQESALEQIRSYVDRWGPNLPISVVTSPDAMWLLEQLRLKGLL